MRIDKLRMRFVFFAVLAAFVMILVTPIASFANVKGTRNTTIGLGAATVYLLLKGKTTAALIAGAGTYYAYGKYQDAKEREEWRNRHARWKDRHSRR